jgi:hypothetical protein
LQRKRTGEVSPHELDHQPCGSKAHTIARLIGHDQLNADVGVLATTISE